MWPDDDRSDDFTDADDLSGAARSEPDAPEPQAPPRSAPGAAFPSIASTADLYRAAHARAVADHELSKLFNPDYYI